MSVQSVHNMLGDLTAAGLIRRIEPAGFAAMYERRVDDNHHHLVCLSCGALTDVDRVFGPAPCLDPANSSGFIIDDAEVTFWGFCSSCEIQ
jgi:Fur family ferric uptake transcriptional regulator